MLPFESPVKFGKRILSLPQFCGFMNLVIEKNALASDRDGPKLPFNMVPQKVTKVRNGTQGEKDAFMAITYSAT